MYCNDISGLNGWQIASKCSEAGLPRRCFLLLFHTPSSRSLICRHFPRGLCSNRIIKRVLGLLLWPNINSVHSCTVGVHIRHNCEDGYEVNGGTGPRPYSSTGSYPAQPVPPQTLASCLTASPAGCLRLGWQGDRRALNRRFSEPPFVRCSSSSWLLVHKRAK